MVTIRTIKGLRSSATVFAQNRGPPALHRPPGDIEAKYRTLMPNSGLSSERIEASLALIRDFKNAMPAFVLT